MDPTSTPAATRLGPVAFGLAAIALAVGCAGFDPQPLDAVPFRARAQSQSRNGVTVTVAVPTAKETRALFDAPLEKQGVQPVWVRIESQRDDELVFLSAALDPDYFSPHEVAWKNRAFLRGAESRERADYLHDQRIELVVPPRSSAEGFVYTNRDRGVKFVTVALVGERAVDVFDFVVPIPGLRVDFLEVDFERLYAPEEIAEVGLEGLRRALQDLPCCVLGGDRKTAGDPLNLVIVAPAGHTIAPFVQRGWHLTERMHAGSVWGTVRSSLFRSRYETSPISPLHLYGRPQDAGLQKARETVDERNHLRLWLSPLRLRGRDVWVGQISRDIGVRLSRRTLVTHEIDPDVDEARDYVVQDLLLSGRVEAVAFVPGVGAASEDAPRFNYTLSPYFTDGMRAVVFLSHETVPLDELVLYPWEEVLPSED